MSREVHPLFDIFELGQKQQTVYFYDDKVKLAYFAARPSSIFSKEAVDSVCQRLEGDLLLCDYLGVDKLTGLMQFRYNTAETARLDLLQLCSFGLFGDSGTISVEPTGFTKGGNLMDVIRDNLWEEKLTMSSEAIKIVRNYIEEHLDKSDPDVTFEVYVVWQCKALQNWKFLLSSTLPDGMYYELTYDGDKQRWYLDAYKKFENRVIPR